MTFPSGKKKNYLPSTRCPDVEHSSRCTLCPLAVEPGRSPHTPDSLEEVRVVQLEKPPRTGVRSEMGAELSGVQVASETFS